MGRKTLSQPGAAGTGFFRFQGCQGAEGQEARGVGCDHEERPQEKKAQQTDPLREGRGAALGLGTRPKT